jgi:hypothetical protein
MNLTLTIVITLVAGILAMSAAPSGTVAQHATAQAQRSTVPAALAVRQIVERAIESAGGEAWLRPRTLMLSGRATFYFQGVDSHATTLATYRMWRVFPHISSEAHKANGKVRFDAFKDAQATERYFQLVFDGKNTLQYYSPEAEPQREASVWENNFGFGILRFATTDTAFRLVRLADDYVEGRECFFIRVIDAKGGLTDFGIDKADYRIRSVGFKTPRGFHQRIYSDFQWHENPRFVQPTRVRLYYDGVKWTDIRWEQFRVNAPIDDAIFSTDSRQSTNAAKQ